MGQVIDRHLSGGAASKPQKGTPAQLSPKEHHRVLALKQQLMDRADEQGYLTVDDVLEVFPEAEKDFPRLEELMMYLYEQGVEIITPEDEQAREETSGGEEPEKDTEEAFDLSGISSHDSISLYLKQMASVPLLTREEEVRLAKQIERGEIAQRRLEKGGQKPYLRRRYERQKEIGRRARAHLTKANTRLVVSIAKRYMGHGVPFLDLIQEGNIGLMKAVDKFDYMRGCKFSTYATWWIRQSITRALGQQGRVIRLAGQGSMADQGLSAPAFTAKAGWRRTGQRAGSVYRR
jgi:RNA polymerase primary sigma factor